MKIKNNNLSFLNCDAKYKDSKVVLLGVPLDTTTSFRPGTRFAPNAIRLGSLGLEWYSPYQNLSTKDFSTCDIGDLEIGVGNVNLAFDVISKTIKQIINDQKKPLTLGGEHLLSYPIILEMFKKYPNLIVIHLDAHTDLRNDFLGNKFSHATFMRHVHTFMGDNRIYQFGIRSGDKEEFEFAKKHIVQQKYEISNIEKVVSLIVDHPVYITIDLDVMDPSVFPGTGTPEPGGIMFKEMLWALQQFSKLKNIVGADVVELSPHYDPSDSSTLCATKVVRELILLLHKNNQ